MLAPYRAASAELPPALDTLAGLTADNPTAQSRIRELRERQERWLREAEEALVRAREAQVIVPAGFRDEIKVRKAEMDGMRGTIGSILDAPGRGGPARSHPGRVLGQKRYCLTAGARASAAFFGRKASRSS